MATISNEDFLRNVENSLTFAYLSDLPLPFMIIKGKLYSNVSKEQLYGIMNGNGVPLSVEDDDSGNKRLSGISSASIIEFYTKIEELQTKIKSATLKIAGTPPVLSKLRTEVDELKLAVSDLVTKVGALATPAPAAGAGLTSAR